MDCVDEAGSLLDGDNYKYQCTTQVALGALLRQVDGGRNRRSNPTVGVFVEAPVRVLVSGIIVTAQ